VPTRAFPPTADLAPEPAAAGRLEAVGRPKDRQWPPQPNDEARRGSCTRRTAGRPSRPATPSTIKDGTATRAVRGRSGQPRGRRLPLVCREDASCRLRVGGCYVIGLLKTTAFNPNEAWRRVGVAIKSPTNIFGAAGIEPRPPDCVSQAAVVVDRRFGPVGKWAGPRRGRVLAGGALAGPTQATGPSVDKPSGVVWSRPSDTHSCDGREGSEDLSSSRMFVPQAVRCATGGISPSAVDG